MGAIPSNLEWLNINSVRSYPIREGQTRLSTDTLFEIPNDFIVDFQLAATSDITRRFYISQLVNTPTLITIILSDNLGSELGYFTIVPSAHTQYTAYYLTASSVYTGAAGRLVVGSLTNLQNAALGTFSFLISTTEFETRTIIPSYSGLSRIIFNDSFGNQYSLTGDVILNAGSNTRFRLGTGNSFIWDAGEGLGLNAACAVGPTYIQTINGIQPDQTTGDFGIGGNSCLDIVAAVNGIQVNDECCKPCVGCDDLSAIVNRLVEIESDLLKLRDQYNSLELLVQQTSNAVATQCEC